MMKLHRKELSAFNKRQEEIMAKKEHEEFIRREHAYITELMKQKRDNYKERIRELVDQKNLK